MSLEKTDAQILAEINANETKIDAIQTDLGDYSGQTNLQSLLAALGIPDTAAKPLYTCLVTDRLDSGTYGLNALKLLVDAVQTAVNITTATTPRIVERSAAVLPASTQTAYYTVTGRVLITQIVGEVTTIFDGTVNSIKLIANPTALADVDLCTALVVTSDAAGTMYTITGTLTDAMVATTSGAVTAQASAVIVAEGTIDLHTTATDTSGATKWTVHYIALDAGSTVVVA